jgi:hypothetical protein
VRIGAEIVGHHARDQRGGRFVVWLYYYFHKYNTRLPLGRKEGKGDCLEVGRISFFRS